MDGVVEKSFSINLSLLTMFGLYPPEKNTSYHRIRSYLLYLFLTYPVPLLGALYFIFEEQTDPLRTGNNIFLVAETGCQITKFLPFVVNGNRIRNCIHHLENQIFVAKNDGHTEIMNKCITTCQRNSNVFLVSVIGGFLSWALRPLFETERRLPVDVWLPIALTNETELYFVTYLLLIIGVGYSALAAAAMDPLIGGLACLAAGQLRILKKNLQSLGGEDYILSKKCKRNVTVETRIKKCIQHHNAILFFIKEYEQCFSLSVFSQFAGSVLVICSCCLQLSEISPTTFNFVSIIVCLSIMLVQIYFYCYYGTIIYEESNTLTEAVYMGTWYEYDIGSRKDLILLMERSKRPVAITAGKVLDLSVITFTSILRRSYSLLAVLKNQ